MTISSGVAVFNLAQFLQRYSEFSQVDPGKLQGYFHEAGLYLTNAPRSIVQNVTRRTWLLYMLVAHISYLKGDLDATSISDVPPSVEISVYSPNAGNFTIAHNLGVVPSSIEILPTSGGAIWSPSSTPPDATYIYLAASDVGVTATINVFQNSEVESSGGKTRPVGRTSSASEGSVSASFDYANSQNAAWFTQSQYGSAFWQATSSIRGARYIPGYTRY